MEVFTDANLHCSMSEARGLCLDDESSRYASIWTSGVWMLLVKLCTVVKSCIFFLSGKCSLFHFLSVRKKKNNADAF